MDEVAVPGQAPVARSDATVLIVDDDPANLGTLNELLRSQFHVRVARSGAEALKAVDTAPRPDLVLLDVMMPEIDGYTVLARLRQSPANCEIPVIFVTAMGSLESEQRGLELGAVDYITKPITPAIVLSRIRTHLEAKAAREMLKRTNLRLAHEVAEGVHALERAQLQLLHAEKMASIGQLAAGVAHEINNPVGFVGSNLKSLDGYLTDIFEIIAAYEKAASMAGNEAAFAEAHRIRQVLDYKYIKQDIAALLCETIDGINRVRKIVQDLKSFAHVSETVLEWADIHECIDSTLNLVWNEVKYRCTVAKNYGSIPRIKCLPSQLNQVFMNLLVNAAQAIPDKGEITITTECAGNDAVVIKISDTGMGISPEAMTQIFDPFYTTKPVGKGTGLGLSLTWNIIARHCGRIEVASEVGKGSTFTIVLPIEPKPTADVEAAASN